MYSIRLFAALIIIAGCGSGSGRQSVHYDLEHPERFSMPDILTEISGIVFYPKDSSVFAISDESGDLFKVNFTNPLLVRNWKFDKKHDFEEVTMYGKYFYVLQSDGNIFRVRFSETGDTIYTKKYNYPYGSKDEFETLYFDPEWNRLILICKDCKDDNKHHTSAYSMDLEGNYSKNVFTINADDVWKQAGKKQKKFKPSAAAINPLTNDIWVLSSINHLIVVIDRTAKVKQVFHLNPGLYVQPEGIAFTPWGDLLISNEAGSKEGIANIYVFKYKP